MGSRYASGSELILKEGACTSNGSALGTTLIDASLIGKPDFPTGLQVRILSGTYQNITRTIESFSTVTGTMTVPTATPFPGQIVTGTGYVIMGVTATSADVLTLIDDIHISDTEELKDFIAKTGGTEIGAAKSQVDAMGHTGLARLDSGLDGVLADGLINGAGTVLPADTSLYDELGGATFNTATDSLEVIAADVAEILDMTVTIGPIDVLVTETILFEDASPSIAINGLSLKVDMTTMIAGDTCIVREYYKNSDGSYRQVSDDATNTFVGAQTPVMKIVGLEAYRYGCKITAQVDVATRSMPIEVIREA
jgi:hypothetical protein